MTVEAETLASVAKTAENRRSRLAGVAESRPKPKQR